MAKRWLEHIPLEDLVTELGFRGFIVSQIMPNGLTKEQIATIDALEQIKKQLILVN